MSDSSARPRVTVTLGRGGPVVNRAGGILDEGVWNGIPTAGGKRSVRDRLGGVAEDRNESYAKRMRGDCTNNSIDTCLGEDDLRFKLMQKQAGQEPRNRNVDLREKLSSRNSRPFANSMSMRPPEPIGSMRHFLVDPSIAGMTRQPILETRDASILGRFPISRNPIELPPVGPPRNISSWTLENLRRRSPEVVRRRSPEILRRRSPGILRRRSPEIVRRRSPEVMRRRSPEVMRRGSPEVVRRRSPEVLRRRSPDVLRRRSPGLLRRRSPELLRQRSPGSLRPISPEDFRQRSPLGLRQRSPLGLRRVSPGGLRQRSPQGLRRVSPGGLRQRSPQGLSRVSPGGLRQRSPQGMRLQSPVGLRRRSPLGLRRISPEAVRRRSPERPFHPSAGRGISPQNRENFQRRPLMRPYDDRGRNAIARVSPRRAIQSSPYQAQTSFPPMVDVPPTVDSFLQSLGLEKYAIYFRAEEVDMNALRQLGDNDLKGLGIPMGPRRTILQAIMSRGRRQP